MPNWCNNKVKVFGDNSEQLAKLLKFSKMRNQSLTTSFSPQTGRDYPTKKESFQNSNK